MGSLTGIIVQHQASETDWTWQRVSGLPMVAPALLSIEPLHGEQARQWSTRLRESLLGQLQRLGATLEGEEETGPHPLGAADFASPRTVCISLAVIGDPNQPDLSPRERFDETLGLDHHRGSILPILPLGPAFRASVQEIFPPPLGTLNADFIKGWEDDPDPIADHLLAVAGLTTPDRRVFISYRRVETAALAAQLHYGLVKQDFDVFLDTVDVPPAAPFQNILMEELGDKAMVVVLDSPTYSTSTWCKREVEQAEKYELGLMVLRTPPYQREDPQTGQLKQVAYCDKITPVIPALCRELDPGDFVPGGEDPAKRILNDSALEKMLLLIKLEHQRSLVQRKRQLESNLLQSLQEAGLQAVIRPDGFVQVGTDEAHQTLIGITARRPGLPEFFRSHGTPGDRKLVVGLMADLRSQRRAPLDWLSAQSKIQLLDTVRIPDIATLLEEDQP